MERGLLWLPLLIIFFWLAWSGWNEYQKIEAYRTWAKGFEKCKYDIYAVLGLNDTVLTWGKPTRKGPVNIETLSLEDVQSIWLIIDNKAVEMDSLPEQGKDVALEFQLTQEKTPVRIPFTEIELAAQWEKYLQHELEKLQGLIVSSSDLFN